MRKVKKVSGVIVPMITPFTKNYKVDNEAVIKIINSFVEAKVYPFVLGTTGEASSVSDNERYDYVKTICREFAGKTTIYAGISGNSYNDSVESAKKYFDLGIDYVVAHLPSYYKLTPDQMLLYFEKLADNIPGSLIVYNILATTHMSIPLEVVDKLSQHENIVALKDSERDVERLEQAIGKYKDRDDFAHILGWAAQSFFALSLGSDGLVPSTGNFVPELFYQLYDAVINERSDEGKELQLTTDSIAIIYQKDRILGDSLAALKIMMNEHGLCGKTVLPPLTQLSKEDEETIRDKVKELDKTILRK
ncbi:dihydrodipicolinate synthase family protein [Bacteroidota bacterium]